MKLRNMRRHLEEGQRRYLRKRKTPCSVSAAALVTSSNDEDPNEWLTVIKRMKPSSENITSIKTAMEKTFIHHRNWISMGHQQLVTFANSTPASLTCHP